VLIGNKPLCRRLKASFILKSASNYHSPVSIAALHIDSNTFVENLLFASGKGLNQLHCLGGSVGKKKVVFR